jgi:DNA ligase-associated metallophosphoesterase
MTAAAIGDEEAQGLGLELAGAVVRLLAGRALWWPGERTLFVADVHLGKAESFRALGVPVPAGPTESTLRRLGGLVDAVGARRLVVLGDLLHARPAQAASTLEPLRAWRRARAGLHCVLVRGNHDDRAGDPPADLGIETVDAPSPLGPFALCHEPSDRPDSPDTATCGGYRLAGHQHPAVRLTGRGGAARRPPGGRGGRAEAVLPAFGDFTGAATIVRRTGERVFAIAGDAVLEVPAARARAQ